VTLSIEHLPSKFEPLSSNPSSTKKKKKNLIIKFRTNFNPLKQIKFHPNKNITPKIFFPNTMLCIISMLEIKLSLICSAQNYFHGSSSVLISPYNMVPRHFLKD
jgi:hypothetical protein